MNNDWMYRTPKPAEADAPAPLPADEQIAALLRENETLRARVAELEKIPDVKITVPIEPGQLLQAVERAAAAEMAAYFRDRRAGFYDCLPWTGQHSKSVVNLPPSPPAAAEAPE